MKVCSQLLCLSLLFVSFVKAQSVQPYCLYDAVATTPHKKCIAKTAGNKICLADKSYDSIPSRCVVVTDSGFALLTYNDAVKNTVSSSETVDDVSGICKRTDVGNGVCGKNGNSPEECDPGTSGAGIIDLGNGVVEPANICSYCSAAGLIQHAAICVNSGTCFKDDSGTHGTDSKCQFLNSAVNPGTGKLVTCHDEQYPYMGRCETMGEPGNACRGIGTASPSCKYGDCDTTTNTCPGCNADFRASPRNDEKICPSQTPICKKVPETASTGTCVECDPSAAKNTCTKGNTCASNGFCTCGTTGKACSEGETCTGNTTKKCTSQSNSSCATSVANSCGAGKVCVVGTCKAGCVYGVDEGKACSNSNFANYTCQYGHCNCQNGDCNP